MIPSIVLAMSLLQPDCITPAQAVSILQPAVVKVVTEDADTDGHGTGVYIDDQGTVVTARHVVDLPGRVLTVNGQRYRIHSKHSSEFSVAVIKPVRPLSQPTSHIGLSPSNEISIASPLFSLGFPVIMNLNYASGALTGFYQEDKMSVIVSSIPAVPGMSGSPVLGCDGKIVGFIAAHHEASQMISLINPVSEAIEIVE